MFGFIKKFMSVPNPHVVHYLGVSKNVHDVHLVLRDIDPNIAIARGAIYAGAALIRDVSIAFQEENGLRLLLRGDSNVLESAISKAHRGAIVGFGAVQFGDRILHGGTPINLIFNRGPEDNIFMAEPMKAEDEKVVLTVSAEATKGLNAQQLVLSKEIAQCLDLTLTEIQLCEFAKLTEKRFRDFIRLSKASVNKPFLEYSRNEI